MDATQNNFWMRLALNEAKKAKEKGEVPVGAVIVLNEKVIGLGHNLSIKNNDPTSHAEIEAIRNASFKLKNYRLSHAILYVTLEPCTMCFGAIVHSRIKHIFYGAADPKSGVCGTCENLSKKEYFNHRPKITGNILKEECSKLLKDFFRAKRV